MENTKEIKLEESEEESFAVGLDILITAIKMIQRELNCNIKVVSIP